MGKSKKGTRLVRSTKYIFGDSETSLLTATSLSSDALSDTEAGLSPLFS